MAIGSSTSTERLSRDAAGLTDRLVDWVADVGERVVDWIVGLGSMAVFSLRTFRWLLFRLPRKETILPNFYQIGVLSLPVIALTGTFIGMVLVAQDRKSVV